MAIKKSPHPERAQRAVEGPRLHVPEYLLILSHARKRGPGALPSLGKSDLFTRMWIWNFPGQKSLTPDNARSPRAAKRAAAM
jgi:hypothetical protein